MDDDFRQAALDYHRLPRPGKLAIEATKRMATQRDLALAYSPGVAAACEAIVDDPDNARDYTARGNLVGVISNGTAVLGLGNIGALAGKPVMEGKAVLFKKFAGIDVFDIEVDASRPGPLLRRGRRAGTDLRRHQPGGHQGPRMLRHRGRPARAHAHPGVPRRPARHRHHRRRRGAQRPAAAGQAAGRRAAGHLRRRRGGAGLRRPAGLDGPASGERDADRHQGRGARRPAATCCPTWRATRATPTPKRCADVLAGADIFLGLSAPRVLKPEWLPLLRRQAADPGAGQSRPGDHAGAGARRPPGRHHRHRPQRLSEPGQQRAVLSVHLPRRAGRLRHHDQRGDEDRRGGGDRRAGARRGQSEVVAAAYGGAAPVFGPDYIIPQTVRSAADPGDRPRRRPRRDGQRRRAPRRSPTSPPIAATWNVSCSAPAS